MHNKLWRITYHYPPSYEKQIAIRCIRSKYKPPARKTYVGVERVEVEEVPQTESQIFLYELITKFSELYNMICDNEAFEEEAKKLKLMLIHYIEQARASGMGINAYKILSTSNYVSVQENLTDEQIGRTVSKEKSVEKEANKTDIET